MDSDDVYSHETEESSDDDEAMGSLEEEEEEEEEQEQSDNEEALSDEAVSFKTRKTKHVSVKRAPLYESFSAESTQEYQPPKKSRLTGLHEHTSAFAKTNEERYQWLEEVKDAEGHLETDPEYDPRTLYIPTQAWAKFTPFEKQYWEIKSKMWNTVVFFKKGKFYELYERDADIAHGEFDLKLAGGGRANMRLAGIPEMSFDYWASAFIEKGYKVAKVDQTETLIAKEMRGKAGKTTKEEKIIRRELSCVLTGGTLTDENMLVDDLSTYCMSIKQDGGTFGVCFVDAATGELFVCQVTDFNYVKLETIISQVRPREILLEKGGLDQRAIKIIKSNTSPEAIWNHVNSTEFWGIEQVAEEFEKNCYFSGEMPPVLCKIMENPSQASFLAFGGLLWYLSELKISKDLVSMGNFKEFVPDGRGSGPTRTMIIDGQSLQNLELLCNSEGGAEGTLFKYINRAVTPFGKRRLREWLCHPLQDVGAINDRYDVVEFWMSRAAIREQIELQLAEMPDLERLLARIHSGKLLAKDFVRVLKGLQSIWRLSKLFENESDTPMLLNRIRATIPDVGSMLDPWVTIFDWEKAASDNVVTPYEGIEPEFDASKAAVALIEKELDNVLLQYRRDYKNSEIRFRDSGKEIYLIEMPAKLNVPASWQQMGATGKVKRYWSPEVKKLVRELQESRELHRVECQKVQTKLYARFDTEYVKWKTAISAVADIDCLLSLTLTSASTACVRPQLVRVSDDINDNLKKPVLEFDNLIHPCYLDFIPNDIKLGGDAHARITLLTGANAAGKSTVLRMACVATILAQLGCFVPCSRARLSPMDRVMTRLGAHDNIMAGKSTFFVELSETERILSEATHRSLLVIDELGRGGSSSDGFAIAEAVLHHISSHIGSLGFFATHYATLTKTFENYPQIAPMRMAILVNEELKRLTFLYKLEPGSASGSFGMHVATMCGIESEIVAKAEEAAQELEHTSRMKKLEDTSHQLPLGLISDVAWLLKDSINDPSQWTLDTLVTLMKNAC